MPLSEQEQRLLDEMERSLYHNDADYVATVGAKGRANYTAIAIGILIGLAGVVTLLVGVGLKLPVVGILGFVLMFGGALFAIAPPRRIRRAAEARDARRQASGFADSFERGGREG
ncbi:DUF3040 domain-containing protein [Homoserinibacter sp. YIM 151385]|uniref:DUF3040 domain-containing protein n=1 Tax=Homoserinibacter sp. YIM 151385 TaxID=2985506 RepID=UPI0022EFFCC6|nr:DUF3040 domain-containing protein [Homoserinibacter sp. YIM 151385]WBU38749.1 DUF3040 domain-containing protein [Homoserinibacter sp. YIM 151385]